MIPKRHLYFAYTQPVYLPSSPLHSFNSFNPLGILSQITAFLVSSFRLQRSLEYNHLENYKKIINIWKELIEEIQSTIPQSQISQDGLYGSSVSMVFYLDHSILSQCCTYLVGKIPTN